MADYSPSKGHVAFNTVGAAGGIGFLAEQLGIFGNNGCCNNGGGLFNRNNNNCYVDQKEFQWAQIANAKDAEIAELKSKDYTDEVGLDLYKNIISETKAVDEKQSGLIAILTKEIATIREENAVLKSDVRCLAVTNQAEHKAIASEFNAALALESERRACGDENIITYTNSNFVKGELVLPASKICPRVQLACPEVSQVEIVTSGTACANRQPAK